jgi:hypothetical protein
MAMDPLHITEFASDRYFTKFNQEQQRQQQNNAASGSGGSASATIAPPSPQPLPAQPSSPFFLPLSETAKAPQESVDEKEKGTLPELKQKKSRFHLGRLLHTKSHTAIPTTPSIPIPTSAPAITKPLPPPPDAPTLPKP